MKFQPTRAETKILLTLLVAVAVAGTLSEIAKAQRVLPDVEHMLFGDFVVTGDPGTPTPPQSFLITLTHISGKTVGRVTLPANGRYRFNNVENGDYILTVELDGAVVASMSLLIQERNRTDIRKDIELAWGPIAASRGSDAPTQRIVYAREAANQQQFETAQESLARGDVRQATTQLEQIVKSDPRDFEAWTELGTTQFRAGKTGEAQRAYFKALELRNDYLPALVNLGKLHISQKKFEAAVEVLSRAVELDPETAEPQFLLGESYLQVKKGSLAVVHLNEALRLEPIEMADAHLRLAALYNAAGLKDRAADEYEQFLEKRPDFPERRQLEKYISDHKPR